MCFSATSKVEVQSSEDVFDLLVANEERIEIENQFRNTNIFFQLNLEDGFVQQSIEVAPEESEDFRVPRNQDVEISLYGSSDVPNSLIDIINQAGQFNEINAQYFEDDLSKIVPSHIYQEL
jgi:hypothetical protein